MPVHEVSPGRFQWGEHGKIYRSRAGAERQAAAAYANGYREDARARAAAHRALSASRRAETRYVLDLQRIMGRVHAGVLHVVHREHLGTAAPDAEERHDAGFIGLGDELLRRIFRFVLPQAQLAFDFMSDQANRTSSRGAQLVGINPRMVPGLAAVIQRAREKNVALVKSASEDFLRQIRETLEENEGQRPATIAKLLQERVDVSKSRAQLIARDQTTKLSGALNKHRQQSAGVRSFKWSTSHDERVRASHRAVDGQVFSWDVGAELDDEDEATFPGQPINCRCVALPMLAALEQPAEQGGEAEEPDEEYEPMAAE